MLPNKVEELLEAQHFIAIAIEILNYGLKLNHLEIHPHSFQDSIKLFKVEFAISIGIILLEDVP